MGSKAPIGAFSPIEGNPASTPDIYYSASNNRLQSEAIAGESWRFVPQERQSEGYVTHEILEQMGRSGKIDVEEVGAMTGQEGFVSKDLFEAHLRRVEEKIDAKIDRLADKFERVVVSVEDQKVHLQSSFDNLKTSIDEQRKEIHSDNMATRLTNYAVLATMVVGFVAVMIALLR